MLSSYVIFIGLLWLLVTLYYLPNAFMIDTIRFSLPLLIIWEVIDWYRSIKRIDAIQKEKNIIVSNPVEAYLLKNYRDQQHSNEQATRLLHTHQQDLFDNIELYSHEIKNSLTILQAAAENNSSVPSKIIIRAVHNANDHLEMLLNNERLEITSHDFNFEWFNLKLLITDILQQNSAIFINKQLIPQLINLDNIFILTDQKWLRFCIYQLLSNAVKYSHQGESIIVKWVNNNLQIIDHGEGIPLKDLPRICDNGFSGNNGHQSTKSTGMGLYLVKKVTNQLNFDLNITSKVSVGTTVSLHFSSQNVRQEKPKNWSDKNF